MSVQSENKIDPKPSSAYQSPDTKPTESSKKTLNNSAIHRNSSDEPATKRLKADHEKNEKINGVALIKEEYLIIDENSLPNSTDNDLSTTTQNLSNGHINIKNLSKSGKNRVEKSNSKGQNTCRDFGSSDDSIRLCNSRANSPEFSPKICKFGEKCRLCHDLRKYLADGKRGDLSTFGGKCPVYEVNGICYAGWKCRFVSSHSKEIEQSDGRKELVLLRERSDDIKDDDESRVGVYNTITTEDKISLAKRKISTELSNKYISWLDQNQKELDKVFHRKNSQIKINENEEEIEELRAQYIDLPLLPSEKRKIYFGAETPILAPLTTQGNLPFRRMCVDFGAQLTYSEMAMSIPLIQGQKAEWTLMKAHKNEIAPPNYIPNKPILGYDNRKDLKFGAQISASKPWQAVKAAEILSKLLPHIRVIDLNCGCPIDMVFQSGAGSALLDANSKLEKMVRGMNLVSGSTPITVKIRMGTKDDRPTAQKTIQRMAFGGEYLREQVGAPGCAAITLHGRSRQQRYTKLADWKYIAECAALIESYRRQKDKLTDTILEADERTQANTSKMYFIGNGDCFSHVDYFNHMQNSGVDSVMIARGALVKPWIFEEIEKGQYLDKSATERLTYVEKFTKYGLETWGSDEIGIGRTRRFLLEWLSFAHRYIPIGILAHLPPSLNDRPPAYRSRDDMETLLASDNFRDWIKIREQAKGPLCISGLLIESQRVIKFFMKRCASNLLSVSDLVAETVKDAFLNVYTWFSGVDLP